MFFFNDAATTEIYTLSLHDALPIYAAAEAAAFKAAALVTARGLRPAGLRTFADRDDADRARAENTYHLVRHGRRPQVRGRGHRRGRAEVLGRRLVRRARREGRRGVGPRLGAHGRVLDRKSVV